MLFLVSIWLKDWDRWSTGANPKGDLLSIGTYCC